ncbi:MAG TPA: hypothetical protein VGF94_14270 [Kofleriaceae bacterium]
MVARAIARIGATFIYALIWLFGRRRRRTDVPWLDGPIGERTIGDAPYRDVADREGLELVRDAADGGLVPEFAVLDPEARVNPLVREFYEHTTRFAMDVWSQTYFPARIGLWLLVTTISRQVNQLNFPLTPLETAHGLASEIILLRRPDGSIRYTGWFRTLAEHARVLYTGFYMTERPPHEAAPCVKVVFPMPHGNATVILRASFRADGSLDLDSSGRRFGEAGFYRVHARDTERIRVWRVATLRERFHVFVDDAGTLRCDHDVSFLGLRVLRLHYKMFRRDPSARSGSAAAA